MVAKFVLFCASAVLIQAAVGHVINLSPPLSYGLGGASAASSAASAAAARRGGASSAASSAAAASAAAARNAAAASAAAASAAAARGGLSSSAASSAAAASAAAARGGLARSGASSAAAASAAGASSAGLSGYDIIYSGPLLVTASSPLYPSGLSISSEIALDGTLDVNGLLPFLSAVGFEGSFPTSGSGIATCGCGSDNVGIIREH